MSSYSPSVTELIYRWCRLCRGQRILLHAAVPTLPILRILWDWPELKPTTPLGSLPVLKIDDISYTQLAPRCGTRPGWRAFFPTDPLEALVVDEAMECMNELMSAPKGGTRGAQGKSAKRFKKGKMTMIAKLQRIRRGRWQRFCQDSLC
jgi:hypothetical protein